MAISKRARQIATTNTNILNLYTQETKIKNDLAEADAQIAFYENVKITSTDPAVVADAFTKIVVYGEEKVLLKNKLKTVSSQLLAARRQLVELLDNPEYGRWYGVAGRGKQKFPDLPTLSAVDTPKGPSLKSPSLKWQYNPPMVKAAYLSPTGLQGQDGNLPVSSPGTWDDATKAWKNSVGSKGAIQMSRSYPYYNKTKKVGEKDSQIDVAIRLEKDDTVYGFKFLYNPTSVTLSWGVGSEIDIAKFTAGEFKAAPITDAALNSSITFSIILNRMLDMNVIDSNGTVKGDPYPVRISTEDAKEIYKKGTMLDLEYLFRAVNGKDSDYNSSLNGMTADLGWLNSFPVELHLGSGLRYLVRVTQIAVDHKIFNERMVPIFSTVDFICKRLPDLPVPDDSKR